MLDPLLKNLGKLQRCAEFCDFIIKVKDREFPVHKVILAAHSPVFESMFQNDMKEKISGMVDIPDCEPSIFEDFLFYLYSRNPGRISSSTVTYLYDLSEKYDVQCLKNDCIQFIKEHLTDDLIIDVLILADQYADEELFKVARKFFLLNIHMIISTTKWKDFAVQNPLLAKKLMDEATID